MKTKTMKDLQFFKPIEKKKHVIVFFFLKQFF
jgi:hypothetical protein